MKLYRRDAKLWWKRHHDSLPNPRRGNVYVAQEGHVLRLVTFEGTKKFAAQPLNSTATVFSVHGWKPLT